MSPSRRTLASISIVAFVAVLGACGSDEDGGASSAVLANGDRVEVGMADLGFHPSTFTVQRGATVTFAFENTDSIDHEALIGDEAAQDAHEAEMAHSGGDMTDSTDDTTATTAAGMSGMEGMNHKAGASDPGESVLVAPGETAEISYTFDEAGTLLLGCHQPGHYDGGMKATITVTASDD